MASIKLNHIAIVVEDMDVALHLWHDALGLEVARQEHNPDESVDIAFLPFEGGEVELLLPTTKDSGVAKYLTKKGAGLHHICLEVDNLEGTMEQLVAHDVDLINDVPRIRPDGIRYAFVHPRSTGGVLLELYELPKV